MHHTDISSKSRFALPRLLPRRHDFSAEEVRLRLRQDDHDPRTMAVQAAAARTGVWSNLMSEGLAFDLGRTATRLPTVVFWYCQGVPLAEIGRRLAPFGGVWDGERALEVATALIAFALNRGFFSERAA
jgi:hypothetical protein